MDWNICLERAPGIEIREAPDGLVVYDAGRDRLHYLNPTAALLLESCDGSLGVFVRSYAFMRAWGPGLREMSEVAVLNATTCSRG